MVHLASSESQGSSLSVLSKYNVTLVESTFPLALLPLYMRSVSFPALIALELFGPRTKRIASVMFDLPEPLGPVMAM